MKRGATHAYLNNKKEADNASRNNQLHWKIAQALERYMQLARQQRKVPTEALRDRAWKRPFWPPLGDCELQELFQWIDSVPLSLPKRSVRRDFSDGVLVAELVKYFCPQMVQMHNYVRASSAKQKLCNWMMLNRMVFSKLQLRLPEDMIHRIVACTPGAIEPFLNALRECLIAQQSKNRIRARSCK
uniref:sperm flagellar protein 1 n=1 Tax=Myxine glutinosa TaxID=7769 RepID=UPI00358EFC35